MKTHHCFILLFPLLLSASEPSDPKRAASTVVLDEVAEKNLGIEVGEAEDITFEETAFALGRIEAIPERRTVVSSRIPGRIVAVMATFGEPVAAGAEVLRLESRQPGDPPPVIALTAPGAGLVTSSSARVGEPVDPDKALLEITDLSEVHAVARVPEPIAGKLKPGAIAHIRVPARGGEAVDGTLLRFGTAADATAGSIDAVFALKNDDLALRPDMRAEFSLVLSAAENVSAVPRSALQGDAANRFVWVADFDLKHAYVRTPVIVGRTNDRFVEIVSGLLPGDQVVSKGAYSLAFAGKGSVSLKEALDAAHGHEHNEDGSELTAAQKAAAAAAKGGEHGHEHESGGGGMLWKVIAGVLALVVAAQAALGRRTAEPKPEEA